MLEKQNRKNLMSEVYQIYQKKRKEKKKKKLNISVSPSFTYDSRTLQYAILVLSFTWNEICTQIILEWVGGFKTVTHVFSCLYYTTQSTKCTV